MPTVIQLVSDDMKLKVESWKRGVCTTINGNHVELVSPRRFRLGCTLMGISPEFKTRFFKESHSSRGSLCTTLQTKVVRNKEFYLIKDGIEMKYLLQIEPGHVVEKAKTNNRLIMSDNEASTFKVKYKSTWVHTLQICLKHDNSIN